MSTVLRKLCVDFASLVDAPANPGAQILIYKRAAEAPQEVKMSEPKETPIDKAAEVEALNKRLADLEKRAADAEAVAKAERDLRVTAEYIDRAAQLGSLPADPKTFGPVWKRIAESLPAEDVAEVERVLKACHEQIAAGALTKAQGASGAEPQTALERLNALAADLVSKGEAKTHAAGVAKAAAINPALYAEYTKERARRA